MDNLEFNTNALVVMSKVKMLIELLSKNCFEDFLLNLDINSEEYGTFHNAYIRSSGNNWDHYELPNKILSQLLDKMDVTYPLSYFCGNTDRLFVGKFKEVEIIKVDVVNKRIVLTKRTLDTISSELASIEKRLTDIQEMLSSKKIKVNDESFICNSLLTIQNEVSKVSVPCVLFEKKQKELVVFFESIGYTLM